MRRHQQGVTLIELLVAITVLAILTSVGVPAFSTYMNNARLTSLVNSTVTVARLARAEAVRRNGAVTFCLSADMQACSIPSIARGYIVFVDEGVPNTPDASDEILLAQSFPADTVAVSISGDGAVRYRQDGRSDGIYVLVLCDPRGAESARTLLVQLSGRVLNLGHDGSEVCS